jgi:outer membrane protein assembly factor BamA
MNVAGYARRTRFGLVAVVGLALALVAAPWAAAAKDGPRLRPQDPAIVGYPNSIASTGDSITRAFNTGTIPFTDRVVRAGLVLDTRDNEIDPHRGIAAEALFASGTGYTRTTASARLFVHPFRRLVLAGRLAAEGTGGNPPLAAMELMESSERPFVAVGGYHSLRAYYNGRFTGPGKLLGGLEARYAVLLVPSLVEVKLVTFYEAGRVFAPGEAVRLTTTGLHRAGGAEVAVRLLRNSLLVVGYGHGSDGGRFVFGTGWCY